MNDEEWGRVWDSGREEEKEALRLHFLSLRHLSQLPLLWFDFAASSIPPSFKGKLQDVPFYCFVKLFYEIRLIKSR